MLKNTVDILLAGRLEQIARSSAVQAQTPAARHGVCRNMQPCWVQCGTFVCSLLSINFFLLPAQWGCAPVAVWTDSHIDAGSWLASGPAKQRKKAILPHHLGARKGPTQQLFGRGPCASHVNF